MFLHVFPVPAVSRKCPDADPDVLTQLDVFEQWKATDDETLSGPEGVDLGNPNDVFNALYKQVRELGGDRHI